MCTVVIVQTSNISNSLGNTILDLFLLKLKLMMIQLFRTDTVNVNSSRSPRVLCISGHFLTSKSSLQINLWPVIYPSSVGSSFHDRSVPQWTQSDENPFISWRRKRWIEWKKELYNDIDIGPNRICLQNYVNYTIRQKEVSLSDNHCFRSSPARSKRFQE